MSSVTVTSAWANGGNNGLDRILARAFGVAGGYQRLNGVLNKVDFDLFQNLGLYDSGMLVVVERMRREIEALGCEERTLEEIYKSLDGDADLRRWMEDHVANLVSLVPADRFEAKRYQYEADLFQRRIAGIQRDLAAFAPEIKKKNPARKSAGEIMQLLADVQSFKRIHDALHQLQMTVLNEFLRVLSDKIDPDQRATSVEIQLSALNTTAMRVRRQFRQPSSSLAGQEARDFLLTQIERLSKRIGEMDGRERQTVEVGALLLRATLRQQMSLFDSHIVNVSERIPFAEFADSIESLQIADREKNEHDLDPILSENLVQNLRDVDRRLKMRRSIHRAWQQIDATIMKIEERLGWGKEVTEISIVILEEVEFHFQNIKTLLDDCLQFPTECQSRGFEMTIRLHEQLSRHFKTEELESLQSDFREFTKAARIQFERADEVLLEDCENLELLQEPISLIA